jgi:hypothetical protein
LGLKIVNPSRGTADPSVLSESSGVRALNPIRFSVRDTTAFVKLSLLNTSIGFAKNHAIGADTFDRLLPRTNLGSLIKVPQFTSMPIINVVPPVVEIFKTAVDPQPSTYFTKVDVGSNQQRLSAMVAGTVSIINNPAFVSSDPMGPVLGIEHGLRNTAVYVFMLLQGSNPVLRICGPKVQNVRVPDTLVPFNWQSVTFQLIIIWNETTQNVDIFTDSSEGSGAIANARLLTSVPISNFQSFEALGDTPVGGKNDITGIYGVEGAGLNAARISNISISTDVGSPLLAGSRPGSFVTHLDSDMTMGFNGSVDPTKDGSTGTWFIWPTNTDPVGHITPSPVGSCRLIKSTAGKNFFIYRKEPGFERINSPTVDGFLVEFKCNISTTGGTIFETDAAIVISDGTSIYQLDFLNDGSIRNLGLLKQNGSSNLPSDHLLGVRAIDWQFKRFRLAVTPRRGLIDLFDAENLTTPVATWSLDRNVLPLASLYPQVSGGFIGIGFTNGGTAVGAFDVFDFRYSYIYEAYETRDLILPSSADPPFTGVDLASVGPLNFSVMPGVLPLPYSNASSIIVDPDGLIIPTSGGETAFFTRSGNTDSDRGGAIEAFVQITKWRPSSRTGVFLILDDGLHAFLLSFIEVDTGRYVTVPLSDGADGFIETVGDIDNGLKLSYKIDWTEGHVYRLERRPLNGVYLFIDNNPTPSLVLSDTVRYSFPSTQLHTPSIGFGHMTDEGATSVWKFVRGQFGSGFEISTRLNQTEREIQTRLSNARTLVIVSAGS